jgi:hypothetical protein
MEPTCAPSSLGTRTAKAREDCVVPFYRSVLEWLFLSTPSCDSDPSTNGRPYRKCTKRKRTAARNSTEEMRRRKALGLPP